MTTMNSTALRSNELGLRLDWAAPGGRSLVTACYLQCAAALFFGAWQMLDARPILGVHPGLKPFKFEVSGAILSGTMALVMPLLLAPRRKVEIASFLLGFTLCLENVFIGGQALRGVLSHYNEAGLFNTLVWRSIAIAIQVITGSMVWAAWRASRGPLRMPAGELVSPPMTLAIRVGLWLFLMAAVSGNLMGIAMRHTFGSVDGGPGLPLLNWSTSHGDLRVSHFFALHAIQALPIAAWLASRSGLSEDRQMAAARLVSVVYSVGVIGVFLMALFGRPFWAAT